MRVRSLIVTRLVVGNFVEIQSERTDLRQLIKAFHANGRDPVRWGETGVMTFIVSHNSDVYEKDLGPTRRRPLRRSTSSIPTDRGKRQT